MDNRTLTSINASLFRYEIPLVDPVVIGATRLTSRQGLVLRVTDEEGRVAFGEAAPLPGFSEEKIEDTIDWLDQWRGGLPPKARLTAPRSALHAVSQAMVELKRHVTGDLPHRVLSGKAGRVVSANAVILSGEDLQSQAERVRAGGYRAAKLKVSGDPRDAAEAVSTLSTMLGDGVSLRLDANRGWTFDEAIDFAGRIDNESIEYIEEPLIDSSELERFVAVSGLRVALDESVVEWSRERLAEARFAAAFVLKPMLIGGAGEVWAIMRLAQRAGARCVFSGAFETDLGRRHLLAMAAAWAKKDIHGLDTARFLSYGLLATPLGKGSAVIDVHNVLRDPADVDVSRLARVW